jgi:hypothetical protein
MYYQMIHNKINIIFFLGALIVLRLSSALKLRMTEEGLTLCMPDMQTYLLSHAKQAVFLWPSLVERTYPIHQERTGKPILKVRNFPVPLQQDHRIDLFICF